MSFPAITSVLDHSSIPSIEKHDKEVRKANLEYEVELKRRGMARKLRPDIDRSKNDVYKDSEIVNHSISSLK
jgi:23S rRNA maturation-related 3'-5' exoribonuclease YhaM